MNSYQTVYDTANYESPFLKVDEKKCYESRDSYYDCLDLHNDLKDNKYKCYEQYKQWNFHCPNSYRKVQSFERQMDKDNNYLYTKEKLAEYTIKKNASYALPANQMY